MTQEPKPADMALPVHMTRLADFLAEPHGPPPEPEKVAVKAAPARMGGGHIVTIHHGGTFTEHHLLPRQAATESAAREQALTRWRKSQEPAALHRAAVANAMQARRRVPDEVAADYPDLVDKYGTSAALPDRRMGRVPGSSLLLRYTAKQPPGVRRKSKGKFVLDVGPDPRTAYRDGEVIDIDGTPHIITAAAATARKFSPEDSDGGRVWSGNVQDVSARPLTPQEAAVYARLVSNA